MPLKPAFCYRRRIQSSPLTTSRHLLRNVFHSQNFHGAYLVQHAMEHDVMPLDDPLAHAGGLPKQRGSVLRAFARMAAWPLRVAISMKNATLPFQRHPLHAASVGGRA